jgi:DNA-binding transcriptional MerR regulator
MRLQQILFYKELGLPLKQIGSILDHEEFDPIQALENHRNGLAVRKDRLTNLIETVDKTIEYLLEGKVTLSDDELFAAFTPEQAEHYRNEARERWGEEQVSEIENKIRRLSKDEWQEVQAEGELIAVSLAELIGRNVKEIEVQNLIRRHHAWIENFYPAPSEVYVGLANMYVEHPDFRSFYDRHAEGLALFLKDAMLVYAQNELG